MQLPKYVTKNRKNYCQNCGSIDGHCKIREGFGAMGIVIHHIKPQNKGGKYKDGYISLCHKCHYDVHTIDGVIRWKDVNPEVTEKYLEIING